VQFGTRVEKNPKRPTSVHHIGMHLYMKLFQFKHCHSSMLQHLNTWTSNDHTRVYQS